MLYFDEETQACVQQGVETGDESDIKYIDSNGALLSAV